MTYAEDNNMIIAIQGFPSQTCGEKSHGTRQSGSRHLVPACRVQVMFQELQFRPR